MQAIFKMDLPSNWEIKQFKGKDVVVETKTKEMYNSDGKDWVIAKNLAFVYLAPLFYKAKCAMCALQAVSSVKGRYTEVWKEYQRGKSQEDFSLTQFAKTKLAELAPPKNEFYNVAKYGLVAGVLSYDSVYLSLGLYGLAVANPYYFRNVANLLTKKIDPIETVPINELNRVIDWVENIRKGTLQLPHILKMEQLGIFEEPKQEGTEKKET